jgi:putative membrane protein
MQSIFKLCYNLNMKIILQWLIVAGAVLITSYIIPGISVSSFYIALIIALVWGIFSFSIKPILHILALPITILTLGLFSLVINGFLFWFISTFIKGFRIDSFLSAILGAFVVSFITWFLGMILLPKED